MLDEVLQVLADQHRRQLLVALLDQNPQDVVQTPEGVQVDTERLEVEMAHSHLPRLEATGYIQWKKQQQVVVRGPEFDQIKPVLELFDENADELPGDWP